MAIQNLTPEMISRLASDLAQMQDTLLTQSLFGYTPEWLRSEARSKAVPVFKIPPQPKGATDADFWKNRRKRKTFTFADMKFFCVVG